MDILCLVFLLNGITIVTSSVSNMVANNTAGFFWSTNYPNNYADSTSDYWYLTSQNSSDHINVYFYDINIESSSNCAYDYVKVYDGPSSVSPLMKKFCGTTTACLTSSGDTLTVFFSTDGSITNRGFRAKYWTTEPGKNDCFIETGLSSALIVAIVVGSLVALTIATIIIVVAIKENTRKRVRPHGRGFNSSVQPPMPPPYMFVNPANRVPAGYPEYPMANQPTGFYGKTQTFPQGQGQMFQQGQDQNVPQGQGQYTMNSWTDNAQGNNQNAPGQGVPSTSAPIESGELGEIPNEPPPAYDSLSPPPPATYVDPPPQSYVQ